MYIKYLNIKDIKEWISVSKPNVNIAVGIYNALLCQGDYFKELEEFNEILLKRKNGKKLIIILKVYIKNNFDIDKTGKELNIIEGTLRENLRVISILMKNYIKRKIIH